MLKLAAVLMAIPLSMALEALPDRDGRIRVSALMASLGSARFTKLVDVQSRDGEHVQVSVW